MSAERPVIGITGIIARIRAEADRRRQIETALHGPGVVAEPESFPARRKYAIREFMQFTGEDLIRAAHQGLLRRPPEPAELAAHLGALRSGRMSAIDLLIDLRWSAEGRRLGVKISGLSRLRRSRWVRRLPMIGPALVRLVAMIRPKRQPDHSA